MSTYPGPTENRRSILRNSLHNFAGNSLPLIVAVLTIPILIRGFGKERFGILSLAWVLIGYFSLADFGLSRALTKFVSERISQGRRDDLPGLIWTALFIMVILGILGAVFLALISPILIGSILKIESTNAREVMSSFYLLSIGIPLTTATAGLRGILEALMRFDLSNYVKIALGIFNFVGPALVLSFSKKIIFAVLILVIGRAVSLLAYLWLCLRALPELRKRTLVQIAQIRPLLKFGGWITVSNIISPLLANFDRFIIGAMVSVSALAFYATPWEVTVRLLIIPASLAGVIFPVFSQQRGESNAPSPDLYSGSLRFVLFCMFPLCLICSGFARELLQVWLGSEYALNSFRVMQVMAVAVLVNGMAVVPYTLIQAVGRPDVTAKFHILELVIYIPVLWVLIEKWGILGAAIAWLVRVTIDLALLLHYAKKKVMNEALSSWLGTGLGDRFYLPAAITALMAMIFLNGFFSKLVAGILALFYLWVGRNYLRGADGRRPYLDMLKPT